jgi:hypothetical protein
LEVGLDDREEWGGVAEDLDGEDGVAHDPGVDLVDPTVDDHPALLHDRQEVQNSDISVRMSDETSGPLEDRWTMPTLRGSTDLGDLVSGPRQAYGRDRVDNLTIPLEGVPEEHVGAIPTRRGRFGHLDREILPEFVVGTDLAEEVTPLVQPEIGRPPDREELLNILDRDRLEQPVNGDFHHEGLLGRPSAPRSSLPYHPAT